ncbi:hypothetical protein [Streptomyces africanus]|uniref:P-loop NTPase n=1 Tax=Streptomyces africanus TaxID=231024 RepID=UPI000A3A6F79|nr:hypothetical protein [Streptomyces africanus]
MEDSIQTLLARLVKGPSFLLLGQSLETSHEVTDDPGRRVPSVTAASGHDLSDAYQRFNDAIRTEPVPEWLSTIIQYPWNGVFTSRIDSSLSALFSSDWRRVVPTAQAQLGRHPRSTTELQLRHLFGGLGLPDDERPPMDAIQEVEIRARAVESLNTLADTLVTPRGVVVVEGYTLDDWLTPQELFAFVGRLQPGQAHLFSATDPLRENPFIGAAMERGTLVVHDQPFGELLSELEETGRFQRSAAGRGMAGQRVIPVGDTFAEVDVSTWNRVIGAARPVDTELLEPFPSASAAMRYQRFRNFLGESEGTPPWKAIASGYHLRRDFEDTLLRRVRAGLEELSTPEPIVVAGQTATGKSIALCALALDIARSGQGAVLHTSRRSDRPTLADIDAFAAWADEYHGIPTLLVWDGMVSTDEYYSLQRQLRSRGRRVLIVGSSYLPPGQIRKGLHKNVLRIGSGLSDGEVSRIKEWLPKFGVPVPDDLGKTVDSSFLAFLYRVLPDTERGLRRGLSMEMRAAETGLEKLAKSAKLSNRAHLSVMAQALADAGFDIDALTPSERPHSELVDLSFAERSSTEQLTAMILVGGCRGLPVPLELPLRVLGRDGSSSIVELVKNFDIFRWTDNDSGNQYLGTRTQLEAELLAKEDLNVRTEVEVIVRMIENLRPALNRWGGEEVQYIVDLMERIGPKSRLPEYKPHYLDFADAFRQLREGLGRTHHRLVLSEATLTREYVHWAQSGDKCTYEERIRLLRDVQRLVQMTLEEADAAPRSRLNLLVELASTAGAQLFELSQLGERGDAASIKELMSGVMRAALSARALDPENVYPVDVVAWTTRQAVESGLLTERLKIDLLANAQASLDSIDPESLSPEQRAKYDQRHLEMSRMLNDPALEVKHLAALSENSDPAAYYFLALAAARGGPDGMKVAVETLLRAPADVRADWRCSRLLLDLFWQLKTGRRFLRGEREVLAFAPDDWEECLRVADAIPNAGGFDRYRLDFLRGLSLFHLGSYRRSDEVFRALDRESHDLSSRVVATYLLSSPDGNARVFTGRVTWATPDGRKGTVWVDQLTTEVAFIPQRFSVSDFRKRGDVLPAFHIAFNMRGALADPIRASQRAERRSAGAQ